MKSVSTYCPWHASVVVITVIATACLVSFIAAAVTYQLQIGLTVPFLILLAILVLAILVSVGMTPLKVKVSDEGVYVRLLFGRVHIPVDEVVSVTHYPNGISTMRLFGSGHFFGDTGLFRSEKCGKYFSLVSDPENVCVIVRRTKMPVAVSVADVNVFGQVCPVKEAED